MKTDFGIWEDCETSYGVYMVYSNKNLDTFHNAICAFRRRFCINAASYVVNIDVRFKHIFALISLIFTL